MREHRCGYYYEWVEMQRELREARAFVDEARKWLENFPKHEAPSNIRCWKIGIGTFLERVRAFLDPRRDEATDE